MLPKTTQVIPILRIFDVEKAMEFYVEYLGFKVDWEHRFEEKSPLYMQVSLGDFVLHLSERKYDSIQRVLAIAPLEPVSTGFHGSRN